MSHPVYPRITFLNHCLRISHWNSNEQRRLGVWTGNVWAWAECPGLCLWLSLKPVLHLLRRTVLTLLVWSGKGRCSVWDRTRSGRAISLTLSQIFFSFCFCFCVFVCTCVWKPMVNTGYLSWSHSTSFIERGSLTELEGSPNLLDLLASEPQDPTYLCPCKPWGYRRYAIWHFNVGTGNLKSASQACTTSTFLT